MIRARDVYIRIASERTWCLHQDQIRADVVSTSGSDQSGRVVTHDQIRADVVSTSGSGQIRADWCLHQDQIRADVVSTSGSDQSGRGVYIRII